MIEKFKNTLASFYGSSISFLKGACSKDQDLLSLSSVQDDLPLPSIDIGVKSKGSVAIQDPQLFEPRRRFQTDEEVPKQSEDKKQKAPTQLPPQKTLKEEREKARVSEFNIKVSPSTSELQPLKVQQIQPKKPVVRKYWKQKEVKEDRALPPKFVKYVGSADFSRRPIFFEIKPKLKKKGVSK